MLEGKELEMYQADKKKVRVKIIGSETLEGFCTEFSSAYDNDPEEASITLKNPTKVETGEKLAGSIEVMEYEIEKIEIIA